MTAPHTWPFSVALCRTERVCRASSRHWRHPWSLHPPPRIQPIPVELTSLVLLDSVHFLGSSPDGHGGCFSFVVSCCRHIACCIHTACCIHIGHRDRGELLCLHIEQLQLRGYCQFDFELIYLLTKIHESFLFSLRDSHVILFLMLEGYYLDILEK